MVALLHRPRNIVGAAARSRCDTWVVPTSTAWHGRCRTPERSPRTPTVRRVSLSLGGALYDSVGRLLFHVLAIIADQ